MKIIWHICSYRIPMLVIDAIQYSENIIYPLCPKCNIWLDKSYMNYCDRCGQRLSWLLYPNVKIYIAQKTID